jgi:hypothetical protein
MREITELQIASTVDVAAVQSTNCNVAISCINAFNLERYASKEGSERCCNSVLDASHVKT